MPLYDLMTSKRAERIPFRRDYEVFRGRLSREELSAIEAWIDAQIAGDKIHTAGWMPGSDWTGTVLEPIYTKAARKDFDLAARAFGLLYPLHEPRPCSTAPSSADFAG
jgi:hypothetical protein